MIVKPGTAFLSKSQQVAQELLARIADANVDVGDTFATEATRTTIASGAS